MYKIQGFDPRLKLLLLPLVAFASFFVHEASLLFALLVYIFILMVHSGLLRAAFKGTVLFLIFFFLDFCTPFLKNPSLTLFVFMVVFLFERLCLVAMFGSYIVLTTPIGLMVESLSALHLPHYVTIPFSVLLRFMPTIKLEIQALKENMLIRGVVKNKWHWLFHPLSYIEFGVIPILMRALKVSDELSASAMVRGLDSPDSKTRLYTFKFCFSDYLLTFMSGVLIICLFSFQFFYT